MTQSAHAGLNMDQVTFDRSTSTLSLTDINGATTNYTFSSADDAAAVAAIAAVDGAEINTVPAQDLLTLERTYSGSSGVLPSSFTTLAWSGSTLTIGTATRTFSASTDADRLGSALAAYRCVSASVTKSLTDASSKVTITITLP